MSLLASSRPLPEIIGPYELRAVLAHGGMATVYVGRRSGIAGFSRAVAIKRLHPQFATDPAFVAMFIDEARLAGCIHHPRVVSVDDVLAHDGELLLVMEFVQGAAWSALLAAHREKGKPLDVGIATKVLCDALSGLHAAHEARDDKGQPLCIVHRDVSPQNILVDSAGGARIIDFGIAKAVSRIQDTREGQLKGKLCYMAPEQIRSQRGDRRVDVYSASAVLWGALAGRVIYEADNDASLVYAILEGQRPPLRSLAPHVPEALEALIEKGLSRDPRDRFATAAEMAERIQGAVQPASERQVARWVSETIPTELERQARLQYDVESRVIALHPAPSQAVEPIAAPPPEPEAAVAASEPEAVAMAEPAMPEPKAARQGAFRPASIVAAAAGTIAMSGLAAWLVVHSSAPPAPSARAELQPASMSSGQPIAPASASAPGSMEGDSVAPPHDHAPPRGSASHAPTTVPAPVKKKRKYYGF